MDELDEIVLFGYEMKLGWGKAMPKYSQQSASNVGLTINNICPNITEISRALIMNPALPKIKVEPPENESLRSVID